jgi:hypothetical protein
MRKGKILYFSGAVWEFSRFVFVFLNNSFLVESQVSLKMSSGILWLSSTGLLICTAFFLLGLNYDKYHSYLNIARLGMLLTIIPGILHTEVLFFTFGFPSGTSIFSFSYFLIPGIITVVDLVFFILILILKPKIKQPGTSVVPDEKLPDFAETRLEE